MPDARHTSAEAPSWIRWRIVAWTVLAACLLAADRVAIAALAPTLQAELGLSTLNLALVLGLPFLVMGLVSLPLSSLGRVLSVAGLIVMALLCSGLLMASLALVSTLTSLLILRGLSGVAHAADEPWQLNLLAYWLPTFERSTAQGAVSLGDRIGHIVGPLLASLLLVGFGSSTERGPRFAADDIRQPSTLAALIVEPKPDGTANPRSELKRLHERVYYSFDPWTRARMRDWAQKPRLAGPLDPVFLLELNAVLDRFYLVGPEELAILHLDAQAEALLDRGLAALSPEELRTFNRLVLEAAYPGQFRPLSTAGWRWALVALGGIVIATGVLVALGLRNRPSEATGCNSAELEHIHHGQPPEVKSAPPWMSAGHVWGVGLSQTAGGLGWGFLVTLLPLYLVLHHGIAATQVGFLAAVPMAGLAVGVLLARRQAVRLGARVWDNPGPARSIFVGRAVAAGSFAGLATGFPLWPSLGLLALAAAAFEFTRPLHWMDAYALTTRWGRAFANRSEAFFWTGVGLAPLAFWASMTNFPEALGVTLPWSAGFIMAAAALGLSAMLAVAWPKDGPWGE